jgi:FkbH-like protein
MTPSDAKRNWTQFKAEREHGRNADFDLRAAIVGSMTVEPLEAYLGAYLLQRNFAPSFTIGPFNQIRQVCSDYRATVGRDDLNAIVVLWRIEDMFPEILNRCLESPAAVDDLLAEIEGLAVGVAELRRKFHGTLIVSTPPYPSMPGFELLDLGQASLGMAIFNSVLQCWTRAVTRLERVRLFDLHGLLVRAGLSQAHDVRKWLLYRQPYTEKFWCDAGRMLARTIAAEKISPKKCVVLDLDNTLWGGIVGEDGLEGIQLGDDFPGNAYREFQRHLLHLTRRGILLAVASKNNPDDAYEVFDRHDAMILSRTDIAVFEVHWQSKVESIKRIASKLNIGLDALVFVDDSPKEIGEVRERLPEVSCVLVPDELAHLPALLAETDYFDLAEVTDEDRRRTEMMAADGLRQHTQETMSEEEFRKSLELKIEVFEVEKQHLSRVAQLINKSNQFNLTTIRRTQDEVEALADSSGTMVLGMTVRDKYGSYGLIGVAVVQQQHRVGIIDTLLMSCRVLGRGVEDTFIAKIAEAARTLGCDELHGRYIPTAKNAMVKNLYDRFRFRRLGESYEWTIPIANVPPSPPHIEVTLSTRERLAHATGTT